MVHYVIYVPGLTDKTWHIRGGQRAALSLWRLSGVRAHYFVADWANKRESYKHKLARLIKLIDSLHGKGYGVSLVAVSAGSSLGVSAFADRKNKIQSVVSICGMFKHPKVVDAAVFVLNPAFQDAMIAAAKAEPKLNVADRRKILVVRAAHDSYVPNAQGTITHANTTTIPTAGHVFSIVMAITIFRQRILRFIKQS